MIMLGFSACGFVIGLMAGFCFGVFLYAYVDQALKKVPPQAPPQI